MIWEKLKNIKFEPLTFYIIGAIISLILIGWFDFKWLNFENRKDVLVEFHGFFFDILIFGILFTIFTKIGDRSKEIKRYQENIDDLKGWNDPEACFKIIGNLKRLLALKAKGINLDYSYLKKGLLSGLAIPSIKFENCFLDESIFLYSKCNDSSFFNSSISLANFRYCELSNCNFNKVSAEQSNFQGAKLTKSAFMHASMIECDFSYLNFNPDWSDFRELKANLINRTYLEESDFKENNISVDFTQANLSYAIFHKSKFDKAIMKEAILNGASFINVFMSETNFTKTELKSTIFESATLDGAIFDNAALFQTNFNNASMRMIKIRNCDFKGCTFINTLFSISQKAELVSSGVDISKARFE